MVTLGNAKKKRKKERKKVKQNKTKQKRKRFAKCFVTFPTKHPSVSMLITIYVK